jgi:hypothetical protein
MESVFGFKRVPGYQILGCNIRALCKNVGASVSIVMFQSGL